MKFKRFDRNKVKAGDRLRLVNAQSVELIFKFMGHEGEVVAAWASPRVNGPQDTILRQRDVLMVVES